MLHNLIWSLYEFFQTVKSDHILDLTLCHIQKKHNSHYEADQNTHTQNENYNEDYNKVVGIAHRWKNECEVKDNVHLQNQNIKLQQEYAKNQNNVDKNSKLELEKDVLV